MSSFGLMANFPDGFSNGILLRRAPVFNTSPGRVLWLDNSPGLEPGCVQGSDNNRGTFYRPYATLQGALNACYPGNGDLIMIKPLHAEKISSATALNLAMSDVGIIGLGIGVERPSFTLDTGTTSTINVTGQGISIQNVQIIANFAAITNAFTFAAASVTGSISNGILTVTVSGSGTLYVGNTLVGTGIPTGVQITGQLTGTVGGVGTYITNCPAATTVASTTITTTCKSFNLDNCEIRDTSSSLNFVSVFGTLIGTANANDGLAITNNNVISLATSGANNLMTLGATIDRCSIAGNYFQYATTNAGAVIPFGSQVATNFKLIGNWFNLQNATGTGTGYLITTSAGTNTGIIDKNFDFALPTTPLPITLSSGFVYGLHYHTDTADRAGYLVPAADS